MSSTNSPNAQHPYERLTPDLVIESVETLGPLSDGRILALNSYENRVYQVGIEDGPPLIAKFYRPGRWSDAAIHEEHAFALELAAQEIPIVPPLVRDGSTLFEREGFRFAIFERRGGRWPELGIAKDREWMGRFLGRIHMVGRRSRFQHRERIDIERMGEDSSAYLLDEGWLPRHLDEAYESLTSDILERV
ncbi:MAG TPA: serine/threonine protein kinase, partial [Steroidobacteraceae bacterium]|nr:serine/threonine protein kinase [Steroidobacteraceae bacterium]